MGSDLHWFAAEMMLNDERVKRERLEAKLAKCRAFLRYMAEGDAMSRGAGRAAELLRELEDDDG